MARGAAPPSAGDADDPGNAPRRMHVAALLLLAALPRFAWLESPLCALDESWSWYLVELIRSANRFWQPLRIGADTPLFVASNLAASQLISHEIGPMRILPAVYGTLSVAIFYMLVRRLATHSLAWRASLLMAVSPFFVYYSKEARPYAQLLFACLLFTWAFFATENSPRRWSRRLLLAALTVLAVGSHYYALVYFAAFYAQRLWHHARAGRRAELRADFITGLLSALAVAPLVRIVLGSFRGLAVDYWSASPNSLVSVVAEEFVFTGTAWSSE